MASHQLIDAYRAELARRLPPDIVDELADGLDDAFQHHLLKGLEPTQAAVAATQEFGRPDQIAAEFARQSPHRHTALALLATGPLFAGLWGSSLITARAWTWTIPTGAAVIYGATLITVVGCLIAVAASRAYATTRLISPACAGMIALDTIMLTAITLVAPVLTWPMALAIPASITRIGLAARQLRRLASG